MRKAVERKNMEDKEKECINIGNKISEILKNYKIDKGDIYYNPDEKKITIEIIAFENTGKENNENKENNESEE